MELTRLTCLELSSYTHVCHELYSDNINDVGANPGVGGGGGKGTCLHVNVAEVNNK